MQNSVTLSQLPYTGFDYGQMYNSLYWVGLFVWSLIIAIIVVFYKAKIMNIFAKLSKVLIIEKRVSRRPVVQSKTPRILTERVVEKSTPIIPKKPIKQITEETVMQDTSLIHTTDTTDIVKSLVKKELAVSRVGQTPDEFSNDDFAIVDFDGVNPDDSWVPRNIENVETQKITTDKKDVEHLVGERIKSNVQNIDTYTKKAIKTDQEQPISVQEFVKKDSPRVYRDDIKLDESEEYPKIVLTREDVTNY